MVKSNRGRKWYLHKCLHELQLGLQNYTVSEEDYYRERDDIFVELQQLEEVA